MVKWLKYYFFSCCFETITYIYVGIVHDDRQKRNDRHTTRRTTRRTTRWTTHRTTRSTTHGLTHSTTPWSTQSTTPWTTDQTTSWSTDQTTSWTTDQTTSWTTPPTTVKENTINKRSQKVNQNLLKHEKITKTKYLVLFRAYPSNTPPRTLF